MFSSFFVVLFQVWYSPGIVVSVIASRTTDKDLCKQFVELGDLLRGQNISYLVVLFHRKMQQHRLT